MKHVYKLTCNELNSIPIVRMKKVIFLTYLHYKFTIDNYNKSNKNALAAKNMFLLKHCQENRGQAIAKRKRNKRQMHNNDHIIFVIIL